MPGTERIGRYELVAHLAAGGMGQVFLARSSGPGGFVRHVVLKTLDLPGTDEDEAIAMFLDEARLLGLLHHQHISPVYEVGKDEHGGFFLVMEYIHGHTAHDVWTRTNELGAALPVDFSLTVAAAAASGLHYAHTRRGPDGRSLHIVHRDVSLSNLMIGFDGGVKLIDFGIAKAANRSTQTQAGFIKGKVGYMAPEQLRGHEVDARTDVFALGIVLYELTTMRRAFREESDRATMDRIRTGAFVPPSTINPDYPPELERIVTRALRVDPRERYADAESMRRELDLLGHSLGLVLGDAAIAEVMTQLFELRNEPWLAPRSGRPSTELEVPLELLPGAGHDDDPGRSSGTLRPGAPLRAATEAAESQLETPPHGMPKRPSAFSITFEGGVAKVSSSGGAGAPKSVTEAVAALAGTTGEVPALRSDSDGDTVAMREDTDAAAALAGETLEVPALREDTAREAKGVSNDTDGVLVVPAPPKQPPPVPAAKSAAGEPAGGATAADEPALAPAVSAKTRPLRGRPAVVVGGGAGAGAGPGPAAPPAAAVSPPAPARRRNAIIGWAVFGVIAGAAIAAGVYILAIGGGSSEQPSSPTPGPALPDGSGTAPAPPPPPPVVVDAAPPAPPDAPPRTQIMLRVTTNPPDATVLLDGKRLGRTPYAAPVDAAPGTHTLKLRRRGYVSMSFDIELSSNVTREVTLQRAKEPAAGSGASSSSSPPPAPAPP